MTKPMSMNIHSLTEVLDDLHHKYKEDEKYWYVYKDGNRAKDIQYVLANEPDLFTPIVIEEQILAFQPNWLENTYLVDTSEPDISAPWMLTRLMESATSNKDKPSVLSYCGFSKLQVVEED